MSDDFDEIDVVLSSAYLNGDLSSLSDDDKRQLYSHLDTVKQNMDSPNNLRRVCIMIFDYYDKNIPLFVLFIRLLTEHRIQLSYTEVPEYRNVVKKLSPLVRQTRCLF